MAKEKCKICNEEISFGFMNKPNGTIVKVKDGEKNDFVYVCSGCQKKHGDKLKDELLK